MRDRERGREVKNEKDKNRGRREEGREQQAIEREVKRKAYKERERWKERERDTKLYSRKSLLSQFNDQCPKMIFQRVCLFVFKEEMSRNDKKGIVDKVFLVAPLFLLFLVKENLRKLGYSSYLIRWVS